MRCCWELVLVVAVQLLRGGGAQVVATEERAMHAGVDVARDGVAVDPGLAVTGPSSPRWQPTGEKVVKKPKVNPNWRRDRLVRYLHFHKVAGTTVCEIARTMKLAFPRTYGQQSNCNFVGSGPHSRNCTYWKSDCENTQRQFARGNVSFSAIERFLDDSDVCPGFVYATTLRDPIARVASHLAFHYLTPTFYLNAPEDRRNKPLVDGTYDQSKRFIDSIFTGNNFYVRSLLGCHRFYTPQNALNVSDLYDAMRRLRSVFHVVMILESPSREVLLRAMPGFENATFIVANHRSHAPMRLSAQESERMRQLNALDLELYDYAKLLSNVQYHSVLGDDTDALHRARSALHAFEADIAERAGLPRDTAPIPDAQWPYLVPWSR